jgi:2'-5' RNA ligase
MNRRVVVLFPTGDTTAVEAFRSDWDPLASQVAAHITVGYPFESRASEQRLASDLTVVAQAVHPFAVRLNRTVVVDGEYLFLLADTGSASILHLHDNLYGGPLAAVPKPERFLPHMTVGRQADMKQMGRAERVARDLSLCFSGEVDALSVYRIERGSRVREFDLPLGSTHR